MSKPQSGDVGGPAPASTEAMRAFWDEKARESPLWFIDSRLDYHDPDSTAFWDAGDDVVETCIAMFGLALSPTDRVLDVGCGIGRVTWALAKHVREVVGVDVSEEMVRRGREALTGIGNVSLETGNGVDLRAYPDMSFDGVFSFVTFQHIPDPEVICGYVAEFGRVLRRGGWAFFQYSDDPSVHEAMAEPDAGLTTEGPRGRTEPQWRGSSVPRWRMDRALEEAGLVRDATFGEGTLFCFLRAHAR